MNNMIYELLRDAKHVLIRFFEIQKNEVAVFFHRNMYSDMCKFKSAGKGKRLFIVATGPSLTINDLDLLKGEDCFSCNSIIYTFNKTNWRPKYYAVCDTNVYNILKKDIEKANIQNLFFPKERMNFECENKYGFHIHEHLCRTAGERKLVPHFLQKRRFSKDIVKGIYEGGSVIFVILQIAFYMGYDTIYFLGADCNFMTQSLHSSVVEYNMKQMNSAVDIENGLFRDYYKAKLEAEKLGIKIYNATRGGKLELFPRVRLEDVINK